MYNYFFKEQIKVVCKLHKQLKIKINISVKISVLVGLIIVVLIFTKHN